MTEIYRLGFESTLVGYFVQLDLYEIFSCKEVLDVNTCESIDFYFLRVSDAFLSNLLESKDFFIGVQWVLNALSILITISYTLSSLLRANPVELALCLDE